jgi:hypothetical protein
MSETLTASFCERCGTRHEFRAPRGLGPIRKTRGFIGGLKQYLVSDQELSEAMREGMQTQESVIAAAQLDAFHASVHLCIGCRQYTCNDCWNEAAGRCRTCAPVPGVDDLADRIAASLDHGDAAPADHGAIPVFEHWPAEPVSAESWPHADSEVYPVSAEAGGEAPPEYALAVVPPEPTFDGDAVELTDEERFAAELETQPGFSAEPELDVEREAVAAQEAAVEPERPALRVVAWDDDAPVEAEPTAEAVAAEAPVVEAPQAAELEPADVEFEPTPAAAPVAYEPEPVAEIAPEPVAAEPIAPLPEPEPIRPPAAAPRRSGPMREKIVRLPTQPATRPRRERRIAASVDTEEVAARRAQLEELGLDEPSVATIEPDAGQVLPYRSRGAAMSNREVTAAAMLWEASAREVGAAGVTVQSCGGCGLALSASARFCRRCGERQAQSA